MSALIQLANGVWLYPHDEDGDKVQPNVGIIVGTKQTVLVDAGNSPRLARRILLELDELRAPPVSYVIYTHSHWDHVFGAMALGATAIGHELCRKYLLEQASKPWSQAYIQEEIQRTPAREAGFRAMSRAIEEWRNFRIVVPEITLSKMLRLHLDGVSIEIEHVGGQHAPDSVIVRVKEAGVMFVSDCYYPPPLHQRRPTDTLDWDMIERLANENMAIYVDGHGPPRPGEEVRRLAVEREG
jgi:glyoxylase-like metal-dependent hydrolase (beta-lactamase superfamily II)